MISFLVFSLAVFLSTSEFPPSEFVTDLSGDSYAEAFDVGRPMLTFFYAPWCGHCKKTRIPFENACKIIKQDLPDDMICSRLDCTQHEDFCRSQNLKGYPTIKFTHNDLSCEYKGPRTEQDISKWTANFYYGMADVTNADVLKQRVEKGYSVVGFLEEGSKLRSFVKSAGCELPSSNLFVVSDVAIAESVGIKQLNSFSVFHNGTFQKTLPFVNDSSSFFKHLFFAMNPLVQEYTHDNLPTVFSDHLSFYLCFIYDTSETLEKHFSQLEAFALQKVPEIRVFTVNGSDPSYKDVLDYFHASTLPQIIFYNDQAQNYHHLESDDFSIDSLTQFVDGCLGGSIPPFVQRQPIPDGWDQGPVKVLVTDTYEKIFEMFESQSGFVLLFASWCGHCQQLMPIWDEFGELVASKYSHLFVAKIDHTQNHVPGVDVSAYPTIVAYKSRQEKIVYSGDRTLKDFEKFLQQNLLVGQPAAGDVTTPASDAPPVPAPEAQPGVGAKEDL